MAARFLERRARRVFNDSGAFLALADERDRNHQAALQIERLIAARRLRQVTTNVLLVETHALFLSRIGIRAATDFLLRVRQSGIVIVRVRATDESALSLF
jgi:predicted nucleic acid-binding protein